MLTDMSPLRSEKLYSPLLFTRLTWEMTSSLMKHNMIIRMIHNDVDQIHRPFMITILYSTNSTETFGDIDCHATILRFIWQIIELFCLSSDSSMQEHRNKKQ